MNQIRHELYTECDLLTGNKNRMCVCDSREELDYQLTFAIKRLLRIHDLNVKRLQKMEEIARVNMI